MATLALHFAHYLHPRRDVAVACEIGRILALPCFAALRRVGRRSHDRETGHTPLTLTAIATMLHEADTDAVIADSGRTGTLIASATIFTGRHVLAYEGPRPPLRSHVIVPYVPAERDALLEGAVLLAAALEADAGYIAVEPDYDRAQQAALPMQPRRRDVRDPRRMQERLGHAMFITRVASQIATPEWAIVFGPGHLARFAPIEGEAFARVRGIGGRAKLAQLTLDPVDALTACFDLRLAAAREALAPILMDVGGIPIE